MPETILRTKLFVPPLRPNLVSRPQLIERLNQGLRSGQKLTLVSAPAGSGKTTLISSWIHQLDAPVAWLSLDEADNEPNRFVHYLGAALQGAYGEVGQSAIDLLQSAQPPTTETLVALLINDLAHLAGQVILVFDDYHVISELSIHQAISFLLDNQPPQLHLVVIGRSDPPFPLHRLRGSGLMSGIFARDLRFTDSEVASFFAQTVALSLPRSDIATLERRTEGWVAGLQLAALSMQELPDPGDFVRAFAGDDRYVSDYLIGEVFERQPAQVQDFLLRTAILDRFSAPLCDAMLGSEDMGPGIGESGQKQASTIIIERLEQANLFTIPLDNKREWYRYHHLFADFLRLRLRSRPAGQIAALHRRAARWFEENGQFAEAIDHSLAGQEFQRAGRLIEQTAMATLWGHTRWKTLIEWIEALPAEVVRSRRQLGLQYAWALFTTGRWQSVEPVLSGIESAINETEEKGATGLLQGEVSTLRAWLAFESDDMEHCVDLAGSALERLPDDALIVRSLAILAQGTAQFWLGQLDKSRPSLEQAIKVGLAAGNLAVVLVAMGCQVETEVRLGRLRRASELYRKARKQGSIKGIALLSPTGYACVEMGEVLREWGHLQEAVSLLNEGVQLCRQAGAPENAIEGQMTLARVLLAAGDESAAAAQMAQAESDLMAWLRLDGNSQYAGIRPALVQRARYWLAIGEVAPAASWLEENGIQLVDDLSPREDERYLLLSRVLIAKGQAVQAKHLLYQLLPLFESGEGPRLVIEALVLLSIASLGCGQRDEALRALSRALRLAEPEGYQRIFLDDGENLTDQLLAIERHGQTAAYARAILNAIRGTQQSGIEAAPAVVSKPAPAVQRSLEPEPFEALTERETGILRLIAAGLTNREIATELHLSPNTIKTYTSRIYGKLGVHNRAEAVARAGELHLL
jgi:LuxR family maltose regulon positive regulatory protein